MILVFVDMTHAYPGYGPTGTCAFFDKADDRFLDNDGTHIFDREDVHMHEQSEKLIRLVPESWGWR